MRLRTWAGSTAHWTQFFKVARGWLSLFWDQLREPEFLTKYVARNCVIYLYATDDETRESKKRIIYKSNLSDLDKVRDMSIGKSSHMGWHPRPGRGVALSVEIEFLGNVVLEVTFPMWPGSGGR